MKKMRKETITILLFFMACSSFAETPRLPSYRIEEPFRHYVSRNMILGVTPAFEDIPSVTSTIIDGVSRDFEVGDIIRVADATEYYYLTDVPGFRVWMPFKGGTTIVDATAVPKADRLIVNELIYPSPIGDATRFETAIPFKSGSLMVYIDFENSGGQRLRWAHHYVEDGTGAFIISSALSGNPYTSESTNVNLFVDYLSPSNDLYAGSGLDFSYEPIPEFRAEGNISVSRTVNDVTYTVPIPNPTLSPDSRLWNADKVASIPVQSGYPTSNQYLVYNPGLNRWDFVTAKYWTYLNAGGVMLEADAPWDVFSIYPGDGIYFEIDQAAEKVIISASTDIGAATGLVGSSTPALLFKYFADATGNTASPSSTEDTLTFESPFIASIVVDATAKKVVIGATPELTSTGNMLFVIDSDDNEDGNFFEIREDGSTGLIIGRFSYKNGYLQAIDYDQSYSWKVGGYEKMKLDGNSLSFGVNLLLENHNLLGVKDVTASFFHGDGGDLENVRASYLRNIPIPVFTPYPGAGLVYDSAENAYVPPTATPIPPTPTNTPTPTPWQIIGNENLEATPVNSGGIYQWWIRAKENEPRWNASNIRGATINPTYTPVSGQVLKYQSDGSIAPANDEVSDASDDDHISFNSGTDKDEVGKILDLTNLPNGTVIVFNDAVLIGKGSNDLYFMEKSGHSIAVDTDQNGGAFAVLVGQDDPLNDYEAFVIQNEDPGVTNRARFMMDRESDGTPEWELKDTGFHIYTNLFIPEFDGSDYTGGSHEMRWNSAISKLQVKDATGDWSNIGP